MAKTIIEELGSKYERQGDYLIPCIALPAEEEQPIGSSSSAGNRKYRIKYSFSS